MMNQRWLVAVAACVVAAATAGADDKPDKRPPADRLAEIKKAYEDAQTAYFKEANQLPDTPEGEKKYQELHKAYDKGQSERFQAALDLAKEDPKSATGFAALEWLLTSPRSYYLPVGKSAMELAARYHAENPAVGKLVAMIGYLSPSEGDESHAAAFALIQAVAEKNPDRTARGQAVMGLAYKAMRAFGVAEHKASTAADSKDSVDADRLAAEAEKAFEAVLKDYADAPSLLRNRKSTLGEIAERNLFELRHLRVGMTAPEIEGEDLDGKRFKLSDYRGKVVLLDFWGDW